MYALYVTHKEVQNEVMKNSKNRNLRWSACIFYYTCIDIHTYIYMKSITKILGYQYKFNIYPWYWKHTMCNKKQLSSITILYIDNRNGELLICYVWFFKYCRKSRNNANNFIMCMIEYGDIFQIKFILELIKRNYHYLLLFNIITGTSRLK